MGLLCWGCQRAGDLDLSKDVPSYNDATRGEKARPCTFGACGDWKTQEQKIGRNLIQVGVSFSANQFSRRVNCIYADGSERTATVVVRALVSAREIAILQSETARDKGPSGEPACESRVDQGRAIYEIRNGELVIYDRGQEYLWQRDASRNP